MRSGAPYTDCLIHRDDLRVLDGVGADAGIVAAASRFIAHFSGNEPLCLQVRDEQDKCFELLLPQNLFDCFGAVRSALTNPAREFAWHAVSGSGLSRPLGQLFLGAGEQEGALHLYFIRTEAFARVRIYFPEAWGAIEVMKVFRESLSALIAGIRAAESAPPPVYELSGMQRLIHRAYASPEYDPGVFHTQFSYHLHIPLFDRPAFFRALHHLLARQPVFRSGFVQDGENLRQRIDPLVCVPVFWQNLQVLNSLGQETAISQLLSADRSAPFGRSQAPFRAYLLQRAGNRVQFILSCHHAFWDGWSLAVFLKDLFRLYKEQGSLTETDIPVPYVFGEYLALENVIAGDAAATAFWKNELGRIARSPLGRRYAHPDKAYQPASIELSTALVDRLNKLHRALRVPLKSIFLAAYARAVGSLMPASQLTIGVVTNGRSPLLPDPLSTLGLFWNLAPVCLDNDAEDAAFITRTHQQLVAVGRYGTYPFQRLLSGPESDLFQVSFNYISFENAGILGPDSDIRFLEVGGLDKFHTALHLLVGRNPFTGAFSAVLNFDSRYFNGNEAGDLLEQYRHCLEHFCAAQALPANI
jgi:hypothetical protein